MACEGQVEDTSTKTCRPSEEESKWHQILPKKREILRFQDEVKGAFFWGRQKNLEVRIIKERNLMWNKISSPYEDKTTSSVLNKS